MARTLAQAATCQVAQNTIHLQRSCATGVVNVQAVDLYLTTKAQRQSFWLVDHVLLKVLCVCPCPPHDCSNRAVGRWGVVALW